MARARPIAKTGPVNRDRLVIRVKPLLKWAHFTPGRNRAQRGQQQNQRSLPAPISAKFDRRAVVMPRQLLGLHALAGRRTRLEHASFSISEANVRFWHKASMSAFRGKAYR